MGFYVLCINQGPHVAPVMGGYIAQNLGWRVSASTFVVNGTGRNRG